MRNVRHRKVRQVVASILLSSAMLVTMLPANANLLTVRAEENEESADAAGTESKRVSTLILNIDQPYEGQKEKWDSYPGVDAYDSEGNYVGHGDSEISWSTETVDGKELATASVTVAPYTGYEFDSAITATVNGEAANVIYNDADGSITVSYTFEVKARKLVEEVYFGVHELRDGMYLGKVGEILDDGMYNSRVDGYSISWDPRPKDGIAVAGEEYTLTFVIKPELGYKFDETTTAVIPTADAEKVEATLQADGSLTFSITVIAKEKLRVSALDLDIDQPYEGVEKAEQTSATMYDSEGNYVGHGDSEISWSTETVDGKELATASVTVIPDAEYEVDPAITATVNGEAADVIYNDADGSITVSYTFEVKEIELLAEAEVWVEEPRDGKVLDSSVGCSQGIEEVDSISWDPMPEDRKAVAGEEYTATFTITPEAGYKFDETTTVIVNDEKAEATLHEDGSLTVSKTFIAKEKELIGEVSEWLYMPYGGDKLDNHTHGYYWADITWSPMPEDGKAVAGEEYTATFTITPEAGYKFDETTTVMVPGNREGLGFIEERAGKTILNEDGTLTVSVTFTAREKTISIEEASVSDIADKIYTAAEQKPSSASLIVKYGDKVLTEGSDYEVSYPDKDYTSVGEKKVKITGIGKYEGSKTVSYQITKGFFNVEPDSDDVIVKDYDGKALENPAVSYYNKDTDTKTKLSAEDYTITWILYSDEDGDKVIDRDKTKEPGIYYYRLEGKGKYKGQVEDYSSNLYRVKDTYTGLKNVDGTWYYFTNGEIDESYSNLVKYNNSWYYVHKGKIDWNYSTIAQVDKKGSWYCVKNGKIDWNYTGLAKNDNGWFYIQKGVLNWNYTGLAQVDGTGSWYYVKNGTLNRNYTGLCKYGNAWYYVEKGVLNWSYTGLAQVNGTGSWYYVKKGVLNWSYTGLAQVNGTGSWYYVKKGVLNWSYTGLAQVNGTGSWYYVKKGVLNWSYTGLAQVNGTGSWYYVKNGVLNWNYTGLCQYGGAWYYVQKGVLNWNYTGLCAYGGSTWYVQKGKVNFSYTGSYAGKKIVKGKMQ